MVSIGQPQLRAGIPPTMPWREFARQPGVAAPELAWLSPAEQVVAAYVLQGLSNKEIAVALGKSKCTVKNQVSAILTKFGVPTRARLMARLR